MLKKDFITLGDFSSEAIWDLLDTMHKIKNERESFYRDNKHKNTSYSHSLRGINPYSIFNYPSMRTIGSYITALNEMGAYQNQHFDLQKMPRSYSNEKVSHIAQVMGGNEFPWFDLAYVRYHGMDGDNFIRELAENSKIPVINAMTKTYHPLQGLTDIFTLLEEWKYFESVPLKTRQITYFGVGNNNVTHSLMLAAAATGIHFLLICPEAKGFPPQEKVLNKAREFAEKSGSQIAINKSGMIARTDAVITDTHALGDTEKERSHSRKILANFVVDEATVSQFDNPNWVFLHCMPIHFIDEKGDYEEVSKSIVDGPQARIFREAENRLYAIMAVLYSLVHKKTYDYSH